jgi:hypothetical protein
MHPSRDLDRDFKHRPELSGIPSKASLTIDLNDDSSRFSKDRKEGDEKVNGEVAKRALPWRFLKAPSQSY